MTIEFKHIQQEFANLAAIHKQCFAKAWSETTFRDMFVDSSQYLGQFIVKNGQNIGFVICAKVIDEAEIMTICLLPTFRKQGLAAQLLTHQIDYLRQNKIAKLYLEVNEFNQHAIHLYSKLGFEQNSIRKNYYKSANGTLENALIFTLTL